MANVVRIIVELVVKDDRCDYVTREIDTLIDKLNCHYHRGFGWTKPIQSYQIRKESST